MLTKIAFRFVQPTFPLLNSSKRVKENNTNLATLLRKERKRSLLTSLKEIINILIPKAKIVQKRNLCIYMPHEYGCNKIQPNQIQVATWMDLEIVILSEVSQTKTNIPTH